VVSVGSLAPGHYEVIINRDVSTCAYVATIGDPTPGAPGSGGSVPGPGIATVAPRYENANGVFIRTFDPSGNLLARGFYLQVMC
jgi:hypothetical protein